MKKRLNNIEFVEDLMTFGPAGGGLAQCFIIIEAIKRYADDVAKAKPLGDEVMISFEAWQACAKHLQKKIGERT